MHNLILKPMGITGTRIASFLFDIPIQGTSGNNCTNISPESGICGTLLPRIVSAWLHFYAVDSTTLNIGYMGQT